MPITRDILKRVIAMPLVLVVFGFPQIEEAEAIPADHACP